MTAKRKYYVLYDVLSDYSLERVDGKSEYGDLAHAKKRAVADNVDPRGKRSSAVKWRVDTKWREGPGGNKAWKGVNTAEELIYIIVERVKPQTLKKNPPISSGDSPRFTQKQLATMRKEFATIKSVDPVSVNAGAAAWVLVLVPA